LIVVPIGGKDGAMWVALGLGEPAPPAAHPAHKSIVPAQVRNADSAALATVAPEAGQRAYAEKCARCHGDALQGMAHAPPLKGDLFRTQWQQKVARDLYRRILSTMPPDSPGTLSERETIDLVLYCLSANGAKLGSEVPADAAALDNITILFEK
jgi:mono/diheme cytochrome c family protein